VAEQGKVFAKCAWRLIPFMMLLYVVSFIDRTNVGFAALTMNKDLAFTPSVFGLGAGLFFITYNLCQVPATILLRRFGARRVIFCIMLVWGLLAASNAFVRGAQSFFALRLLLGVAEAGFFPGMIFYLTLWFPQAYRGRFSGTFSAGIPLSGIIGGPLSGMILGMDGVAGMHGWQWMFLIEGLPAILLAFAVLKFLPDGPRQATWLNNAEKSIIAASLTPETVIQDRRPWLFLADSRVWALGIVGFCNGCAVYGLALWLPQMIQAMGFSNRATGFVAAVPYIAGMGAMIFWGRSSDIRGDRIWHLALAYLLVAASFTAACLTQSNTLILLALTVGVMGVYAMFGPYFSLPSSFLRGTAAAGGIALVNSIATMGGFIGPFFIGIIKEKTGSYTASMAALAIMEGLAALAILALGRVLVPKQIAVLPRGPI
jgi:ACS family tartrate transporter-like MFS transporter